MSKKRTVLYLEIALFVELRKLAFEQDRTRSDLINDAVREYLKSSQSQNGKGAAATIDQ